MDYRQLGHSGLKVSVLTMGTMTFGGGGKFANVGSTDVDTAREQVDLRLPAGVHLVAPADAPPTGQPHQRRAAGPRGAVGGPRGWPAPPRQWCRNRQW